MQLWPDAQVVNFTRCSGNIFSDVLNKFIKTYAKFLQDSVCWNILKIGEFSIELLKNKSGTFLQNNEYWYIINSPPSSTSPFWFNSHFWMNPFALWLPSVCFKENNWHKYFCTLVTRKVKYLEVIQNTDTDHWKSLNDLNNSSPTTGLLREGTAPLHTSIVTWYNTLRDTNARSKANWEPA